MLIFLDLLALRKWLALHERRHIVMESTEVFWQSVYAFLETGLSDEMHSLVVTARHMRTIPERRLKFPTLIR